MPAQVQPYHPALTQIHPAREVAALIQKGLSAQGVVRRLGYFDQPHVARSLTRYVSFPRVADGAGS